MLPNTVTNMLPSLVTNMLPFFSIKEQYFCELTHIFTSIIISIVILTQYLYLVILIIFYQQFYPSIIPLYKTSIF